MNGIIMGKNTKHKVQFTNKAQSTTHKTQRKHNL